MKLEDNKIFDFSDSFAPVLFAIIITILLIIVNMGAIWKDKDVIGL
jgi:hypothetical protein